MKKIKKNGEYVGVDEKFIPENEKYVDESLLGNKEKTKKTVKKFAIGYIIFIPIFGILLLSIPIIIFTQARKQTNDNFGIFNSSETNGNKYTFSDLQGTQSGSELIDYLDDIITNNKLDKYTKITVVYNGKSSSTEDELLALKNELPNISTKAYEVSLDYTDSRVQAIDKVTIKDKVVEQSASSFNFDIKDIEGENYGATWRLDYVIKSNKNNDKHIINVVYKENAYVLEDEIITLKRILDDGKKYQYSLDYDEKGYINKITIKDI